MVASGATGSFYSGRGGGHAYVPALSPVANIPGHSHFRPILKKPDEGG